MIQIKRFCRYFFCFSILLPAVLWADPTVLGSSNNTSAASASSTPAVVEAVVNTTTAESASNTSAAQAPAVLPEVVITANRVDMPVSQVTSSLTVLTAKDLEQKQDSTAFDALQEVPGLHVVQTGAPGETSSLYTRGGNDDSTLVMMDGIPLNNPIDPSRSYDYLDQFSLDGVQQIEIVRGPQSSLYGSAAMAGVVNIITQNGNGPLGGSLSFEGGSYNTFQEQASAQGGDAGANFSLTASRFDTAGFPSGDASTGDTLNNPDDDTSGLLKVGASPVSNLTTNLVARYSQSHTNILQYAGVGGEDPNYFSDQKQLTLGSQTKLDLGDWEQVLGISFVDDNVVYTDQYDAAYPASSDSTSNYDGQMAKLTWQNNLKLAPEETLVLGGEGYKEWGYVNDAAYADYVSHNAEMGSAFLQSQTHVEDRFFLNLGGRFDAHNQFGTHTTFQGGAAYFVPGMETKLSANVGTGFEAPDLYQLYDPSYGNPALQPETNTGFDFGMEQPLEVVKVGATFFHDDYANLFGADPLTYQYINVALARTQGVEAFVELMGVKNLQLRVDYTYLDSRDISTSSSDLDAGLPLLRRPAHQGDLDGSYQFGKFELGGSLIYVGTRLDENFNTSSLLTMPAYLLVNLRGSFQLDDQVKLFARVDNLFNQSYEEVFGYATPGLSAYGGIKVSL
jgi:vitamin B12 transporter